MPVKQGVEIVVYESWIAVIDQIRCQIRVASIMESKFENLQLNGRRQGIKVRLGFVGNRWVPGRRLENMVGGGGTGRRRGDGNSGRGGEEGSVRVSGKRAQFIMCC
jgi:hypothetical protein